MTKALRFLAIACLLATGLVPLVMTPSLAYPFITGKAFAFRILTEAAFIAWAILAANDARYRPKPSRLLLAFALVLAAAFIADLRSDIPGVAFQSGTSRMDGFINLAHLFAFFVVASSIEIGNRLIAALVLGSVLVAIVTLYQLAGLAWQGYPSVQLWSTFGNPSFLGQYAALMAFLAAFLSTAKRAWLWRGIMLLNLIVVGLSQSRGAVLAVAAGLVICLLAAAAPRLRLAVAGLAILAVTIFAVPMALGWEPLLVRFSQISTSNARIPVWTAAAQAIQDRPLLGWGQEGFREAHNHYCVINCHNFDRGHNLIIDHMVEGGVIGTLAWLWLLASGTAGARAYGRDQRAALYGFFVAYFVSDMFLFDTLTSYLPLVSVLAICASVERNPTRGAVVVEDQEASRRQRGSALERAY